MDKVYQKGYDLALDKLNVAPDHELRVPVSRPDEPSNDEGAEDEQDFPAIGDAGVQVADPPLETVAPSSSSNVGEGTEPASGQEEADHIIVGPTVED